jgi:hypothetical protein
LTTLCHPPSRVHLAEQFGTLATLHPGRIDLGLGRAPGSDRDTMYALRRDVAAADIAHFAMDHVCLDSGRFPAASSDHYRGKGDRSAPVRGAR